MTKEEIIKELANDLFDVVTKYRFQMTAAELVGALELHKQEIIWNHFSSIKKEMLTEKNT